MCYLVCFTNQVLPTVVFFSAIISGLYYLGVMQIIIRVIGGFLERVMGTTTAESLNAAANIFIGQVLKYHDLTSKILSQLVLMNHFPIYESSYNLNFKLNQIKSILAI